MQEPVQKIEPVTPAGPSDTVPHVMDRASAALAPEVPPTIRSQVEVPKELEPASFPTPFSQIALRFRVDPKSGQITVLVLDKTSRKVLRTIPPEEVEKLSAGDLLELFA